MFIQNITVSKQIFKMVAIFYIIMYSVTKNSHEFEDIAHFSQTGLLFEKPLL